MINSGEIINLVAKSKLILMSIPVMEVHSGMFPLLYAPAARDGYLKSPIFSTGVGYKRLMYHCRFTLNLSY